MCYLVWKWTKNFVVEGKHVFFLIKQEPNINEIMNKYQLNLNNINEILKKF